MIDIEISLGWLVVGFIVALVGLVLIGFYYRSEIKRKRRW